MRYRFKRMSPDYDMPEIVRDAPPPRAARRPRETQVWRVSIVSAFFAVIVAANLFVGAVVVFGHVQERMQPAIPGATGPTALITQPMLDGTFCRYSVFDNNSARTLDDKVELCGARGRVAAGESRSSFRWGGK